jgi:hypothetical protein
VPITLGRAVVLATPVGERVRLDLDDGSMRMFDHVVLGTGYGVDISRYTFLSPEIIDVVVCANGYPKLSPDFESSVAGLHFLGAAAAWSFGPLSRFVAGTDHAARALARCVKRESG